MIFERSFQAEQELLKIEPPVSVSRIKVLATKVLHWSSIVQDVRTSLIDVNHTVTA